MIRCEHKFGILLLVYCRDNIQKSITVETIGLQVALIISLFSSLDLHPVITIGIVQLGMLPQLLSSPSDQRPRTGNVQRMISFAGNERLGSPASLPLLRSNTKRRKGRFHSVGTIDVDEAFGDEESSTLSPSIFRDDASHVSSRNLKASVLEKRKSAKVSALLNDLEKIGYDTIGGTGENMGSDGMRFLSNTSRLSTAESRSRLIAGKQSSMSIAIEIETRYMELKEKEKDSGPMPTRFKAAVVGDLLHRMESMYGDASRLLKPLTNELLACVFADFAEASKKNRSPENYATFLASLHPYFEDCDHMRQELEDTKLELDAIHRGYKLKEIVKRFQTVRLAFQTTEVFLRDACFRLWKLLCLRRKQRERVARLRSLRYRWSRWVAFCGYKKKLDEEEFEQVVEEKMLKLAQFGKSSRKLKKQPSQLQRSPSNLSQGVVNDSGDFSTSIDAVVPIETDEFALEGNHERAHVPFSVEIDVQVEEEGNQIVVEPSPKIVDERDIKFGEHNRLSSRDFAASTEDDGDDEEKDDAAFHPIAIVRQSTFHHNQQNVPASWLNIHTVSTQTPPCWIEEYAGTVPSSVCERDLAGLMYRMIFVEQRRVEQALALMKDKVVPLSQGGSFSASSDSAVPSPEKLFDSKMSISAARQLIAYVYERKFCDLQQNSNWVKSFEDYNLTQFSHLVSTSHRRYLVSFRGERCVL